jgi:hypothetical protein
MLLLPPARNLAYLIDIHWKINLLPAGHLAALLIYTCAAFNAGNWPWVADLFEFHKIEAVFCPAYEIRLCR